jgi:polyhydroxybutyrate depolymerase
MNRRKVVIGGILILVGVPALLVLSAVVLFYSVFYFPNRTTATSGTIISSGEKREYLLYVPKSYDRLKPAPLVISMHSAMSWPSSQMMISQWNRVADEHGFLVAYPAGIGSGPRIWLMSGWRTPSRMPDVVFISELIHALEGSYNIDPTRIYADGFSNGGGMAFVLSCTLADRIAAVGMVASAQLLPWSWCTDSRPLPMIAFHGTADPMAPYDGGVPSSSFAPSRFDPNAKPYPSIPGWTASWARRNHCGANPVESLVAAHVTRLEYTGCAERAAVVLYTVREGGHTWPGGTPLPEWGVGPTSREIDATRLMWEFFREHRLPSR